MQKIWLWLPLLISVTAVNHVHAQFGFGTLVQDLIVEAQTIDMVVNQVIDLTGLDDFILDDGSFADDLAKLFKVTDEMQGPTPDKVLGVMKNLIS